MMVDPGSGRWWWSGPGVGRMRRRGMGRRPARLMYAGFPPQVGGSPGRWPALASPQRVAGGIEGPGSVLQRGAQLGTPGTCWCSVVPKDLSDLGALAQDLAPDRLGPHRGHTRATNNQIRADNTGHQWFGILPAHRSDPAIRPRSPARSGRCPIGSVAQRARCPRLHMSQPVNVTCWHQTAM